MPQELQLELEQPPPSDEAEPWGPPIPEDVTVDLPFPMFLGSRILDYGPNGANVPIHLLCKIEKNKTAHLVVLHSITQEPMGELAAPLPPPPNGTEIADHWVACLAAIVPEVIGRLEAQVKAEARPKLVTKPTNIITVGDLR